MSDVSEREVYSLLAQAVWALVAMLICVLAFFVGLLSFLITIEPRHAAPVQLTEWKISAIKLMILLERKGAVTRADMKALRLSPTRWTDRYHGFLMASPTGYVKHTGTPDLKAQHPKNWAEIEADFDKWGKDLMAGGPIMLPGVDTPLL